MEGEGGSSIHNYIPNHSCILTAGVGGRAYMPTNLPISQRRQWRWMADGVESGPGRGRAPREAASQTVLFICSRMTWGSWTGRGQGLGEDARIGPGEGAGKTSTVLFHM